MSMTCMSPVSGRLCTASIFYLATAICMFSPHNALLPSCSIYYSVCDRHPAQACRWRRCFSAPTFMEFMAGSVVGIYNRLLATTSLCWAVLACAPSSYNIPVLAWLNSKPSVAGLADFTGVGWLLMGLQGEALYGRAGWCGVLGRRRWGFSASIAWLGSNRPCAMRCQQAGQHLRATWLRLRALAARVSANGSASSATFIIEGPAGRS